MAADAYTPVTPEAPVTVTEEGWTFSIAPYFWRAGISGDVAQFGLPAVDVDASFSDIFDHLDFGAMAIGEARYDRYSIFGDIMYVKISGAAGTPRDILASSVEVSSETSMGLLGAGYALVDNSSGRLDVIGGVRVWAVTPTSPSAAASLTVLAKRRRNMDRRRGRPSRKLLDHAPSLSDRLGSCRHRRGRY
jgi:hypothetical protein